MNEPLLSIIIPTLHREKQVEELLKSILRSFYKNYEVLIVDQNFSSLLDEIVDKYSSQINIRHYKVDFRGLSKAKNYGAQLASGNILCFPDDDCEVFQNTFKQAVKILYETHSDVIFGKCVERDLSDSVIISEKKSGYLTTKKNQGMWVEATMFIWKNIFEKYQFDESFGVGTFYGAEEGHDLILRMLNDDVKIFYSPNILFYHPRKVSTHQSYEEIKRVFTYKCGFSHLCIKHKLYGKLLSRLFKVFAYIFYVSIFKPEKVRYYCAELLGILTGTIVRKKSI